VIISNIYENQAQSYHHGGDINNDGYDDYVFIARNYESPTISFYAYYGGTSVSASPDLQIEMNSEYNYISNLLWQGDYNNDGFSDLLTSWSDGECFDTTKLMLSNTEQIFSFDLSFYFPTWHSFSMFAGGDFNNDRYDDFVVSDPDMPCSECVWVVFGGEEMDNDADVTFSGVPETGVVLGSYIWIGDYNGDGIQDLAMTQGGYDYEVTSVDIYCGGDDFGNISTAFIPAAGFLSQDSSSDFNGDGYSDFCGSNNGNLFFMLGSDDLIFDFVYLPLPEGCENIRAGEMFYCNINNDEYDDVVAKVADEAFIYLGGIQMPTVPAFTIPIPQDSLGTNAGLGLDLGDFNNDGYNDILISDGLAGNTATIYTLNPNPVDEHVHPAMTSIYNYPNPFTTSTTFQINTKEKLHNTRLEIFNIRGQMIKQIPVSSTDVNWNGDNEIGESVSSGIYFYKVVSDGFVSSVNKMLRVK
jgi:hypothetical protein